MILNTLLTTHYSSAELHNLIESANKACDRSQGPALTLLKINKQVGYKNETANGHKMATRAVDTMTMAHQSGA